MSKFRKILKTGWKHHKPHHNKKVADISTSFWKKSKKCAKNRFCFKIAFFMQVLFVLLLLLKCCLSKSSYSGLHFGYPELAFGMLLPIYFSFFYTTSTWKFILVWSHVPVRGAVPSNAKWPSSHLQKFPLIRGINCNFSNYVLASPADPHYIYGVHNLLVLIWMFMSQKSHFW